MEIMTKNKKVKQPKAKVPKTIMQLRKFVERRRLAIQAAFTIITNSYIVGFIRGIIYTGSIKNICVPGLNCYSCPGALGACPIGALQAILNKPDSAKVFWDQEANYVVQPPKYWFPFYAIGIIMFIGALCGRLVCGFLCPFGWLQDLLYKIPLPKKLKIKTFPGDKQLRYLKYIILVVFVIILPLLYAAEPFFCKYICPSGMLLGGIPLMTYGSVFGNMPIGSESLTSWAEAGGITALKLSILAVTIILSIMIYRPFCKYVCPLGALYSFFNRVSLYRYKVDEEKCTHCDVCKNVCKMGVDISKTPNSPECIRCGDCKAACPHHAISSGFGKIKIPGSDFKQAAEAETEK